MIHCFNSSFFNSIASGARITIFVPGHAPRGTGVQDGRCHINSAEMGIMVYDAWTEKESRWI
jgi:hypothetical protein